MKRNGNRTNSAKDSATSARTTEQAVTTYRNALDATGVNVLGLLEDYLPADDNGYEWYCLMSDLACDYDIADEEGNMYSFFAAYVTDATEEQAEALRDNYDTIYIEYSNELEMYVLMADWYGCSMDNVPVYTRNA